MLFSFCLDLASLVKFSLYFILKATNGESRFSLRSSEITCDPKALTKSKSLHIEILNFGILYFSFEGNVGNVIVDVGSLKMNKDDEEGEFQLLVTQLILHPDYQVILWYIHKYIYQVALSDPN